MKRSTSSSSALALYAVRIVSVIAALCAAAGSGVVHAYARPPRWQAPSRSPEQRRMHSRGREATSQPVFGMRSEIRGGGDASKMSALGRRDGSLSMTTKNDAVAKNGAQYNLIWSPNFWKKLVASSVLWYIVQIALKKNNLLEKMAIFSKGAHSCHGQGPIAGVFPNVVLPLLSSSCCAIQLMINALSGWGCAGFNTYLGPIRPALLSVLLLSTWELLPQRSPGWTALSLLLAFLPELVHLRNEGRSRGRSGGQGIVVSAGGAESTSGPSAATTRVLRIDIPSMGCVACVNKVNASIRGCASAANVKEETSWLTPNEDGATKKKGGAAEVTISAATGEELDGIAGEVVAAVRRAGFECSVI